MGACCGKPNMDDSPSNSAEPIGPQLTRSSESAIFFSDANVSASTDDHEEWDKNNPDGTGRRIKTEFLDLRMQNRVSDVTWDPADERGSKRKKKRRWRPSEEDYMKWSPRSKYASQNRDRGVMPWDEIETNKAREMSPRRSLGDPPVKFKKRHKRSKSLHISSNTKVFLDMKNSDKKRGRSKTTHRRSNSMRSNILHSLSDDSRSKTQGNRAK